MSDKKLKEIIDLIFNTSAICPYCGYRQLGSREAFSDDPSDGDMSDWCCQSCERDFEVVINLKETYTSRVLE